LSPLYKSIFIFLDPEIYWITDKPNISYWLDSTWPCNFTVIFHQETLRYISCYEEGKISSRTLMSLNMIHQVPISQRYGYPFTDNVKMTIKHLSPHLGIIVVLGLRVICTIITVRISYDIFITYYVVFSRWVNPV